MEGTVVNRLAKAVVAYLIGCAMVFFFGAFVSWELNPGQWEPSGRFMVGMMGPAVGLIAALFASELS